MVNKDSHNIIPQSDKSVDILDLTWFDNAACKGKTLLMFPKEHKDITYIAQARAICKSCLVQKDYVLSTTLGVLMPL